MRDAVDLLKQLSEKLGIASDKIWETLVYQAHVNSIVWVVWLGASFISVILLNWLCREVIHPHLEDADNEPYIMALVVGLVLVIANFFICIGHFYWFLTCLMNPDMYAINRIVEFVK